VYVRVSGGSSSTDTAAFRVYSSCDTSYSITEGAYVSQDVTHGSSSVGYTLPSYTASNPTCGVANLQETSSSVSVSATGTVHDPVASGGDWLVKPISTGHQTITFRIKVTLSGGKTQWFGQYTLYVGCISGRLTYTDGGSAALQAIAVGGSTAGAYVFDNPTATPSWCTVQSNTLVNAAGSYTSWSGTTKMTGTGTSFNLVSSAASEDIAFKIRSNFPNGQTHLSPALTMRINCLTLFADTGDQAVKQLMQHGDGSGKYELPTYTLTNDAACVDDTVASVQITSSWNSQSAFSTLAL
jgi:hypothetical protein